MANLSNRALIALEVLKNGGEFVIRLERNSYTMREQFQTRLIRKGGAIVRGIGGATYHEMDKLNMLRVADGGTSVSSYYKLSPVAQWEGAAA